MVRADRLTRKVLPRAEKLKARHELAKIEEIEKTLKVVRAEWLPLLLKGT